MASSRRALGGRIFADVLGRCGAEASSIRRAPLRFKPIAIFLPQCPSSLPCAASLAHFFVACSSIDAYLPAPARALPRRLQSLVPCLQPGPRALPCRQSNRAPLAPAPRRILTGARGAQWRSWQHHSSPPSNSCYLELQTIFKPTRCSTQFACSRQKAEGVLAREVRRRRRRGRRRRSGCAQWWSVCGLCVTMFLTSTRTSNTRVSIHCRMRA